MYRSLSALKFILNHNLKPRQVGDWKTGRLSQAMVESYLDRHTLVFDRELLGKMFTEADYQREGSLDTRAITIAIGGRFPKREHTADWRTLAAMLLGQQELLLTDDVEAALRATHERPPGGGTYNSASFWDQPPPPLPPVRRRSSSGRAKPKVSASTPSAEWQGTMSRTAAAAEATGASSSAPGSPMMSGLGPGLGSAGGFGGASLRTGSAGGGLDGLGAGSSMVGTTGGLKQLAQHAEEQRINAAMGAGPSSGVAASTFGTLREFNDFSRGLELLPRLAADSGAGGGGGGAGPGPGSTGLLSEAGSLGRTATRLGEPKSPVRVWAASLPPSAISLPPSALRTLRESVRSTTSTKQDFARSFKPLDSNDLDLKKTLGQPMDVQCSMARVEPVRDSKVLPGSDYVMWGDYAANCRTAPTKWYNQHPAALAQDSGEHKYPWC